MELSEYEQRIGKSRHIEVKIVCKHCGKECWSKWSRVKVGLGKFCSRECSSLWQAEQKGKKYVGKENGKVSFVDVVAKAGAATLHLLVENGAL